MLKFLRLAISTLLPIGIVSFASPSLAEGHFLIFGGRGHNVFLGCITCGEYDQGSINNQFNDEGSQFGKRSIFNQFSDYGSQFSDYSACNPRANYPPIVIDEDGIFYGYLNVNSRRYSISIPQLSGFTAGVCR